MLQDVCDNIKTAIEQGRTDIIKSVLEACKIIFDWIILYFNYLNHRTKLVIV
jgi:hypothetical protein